MWTCKNCHSNNESSRTDCEDCAMDRNNPYGVALEVLDTELAVKVPKRVRSLTAIDAIGVFDQLLMNIDNRVGLHGARVVITVTTPSNRSLHSFPGEHNSMGVVEVRGSAKARLEFEIDGKKPITKW